VQGKTGPLDVLPCTVTAFVAFLVLMRTQVLDHGYVEFIEKWGSDERIIEAARMSTDKGFLGWDPGPCPSCAGSGLTLEIGAQPFDQTTSAVVPCTSCDGKGSHRGDAKLLEYLYKNSHSTPFEMAGLVVEIQAPIFVFREWQRHRTQSYNEMSGRYTPLPDLNYVPTVERLMINAGGSNRQAGTVSGASALTEQHAEDFRIELRNEYRRQQELYERYLALGVPKELARIHLPVGRYSKMRASANLRNWLAFLTLRDYAKAQYEIRMYAKEIAKLIEVHYPRTYALYVAQKSA
jgi:thymidylate synthase (FAD)